MIKAGRWFNFRPISLAFVSILLGSLLAYYYNENHVVFIIILVAILVLLALISIITRRFRGLIIMPLGIIVGVVGFNLAVASFNTDEVNLPNNVVGRVDTITKTDYYTSIILKNVSYDGEEQDYNVICYIDDDFALFEDIEIGNIISFEPYRMARVSLFNNTNHTPSSYAYKNNLKYTLNFNTKTCSKIGEDIKISDIYKDRVKSVLSTGLTRNNAELAYSSMFGDRGELDNATYNSFRLAGTAHLLAVYGLHVGIIVMLITKFLSLIRVKRWPNLIITSLILVFYCVLCGFTPSVVRASIMAVVMLGAKTIYREYDSLSAMSLAGIIIFLINPFCLFDVGFLLSFLSVFGIVALYKPIKAVLTKAKINDTIASSMAITLSVMLAIMFVQFYFFGGVNPIVFLSNLVMIPLFTLAFSVTFVISVFATALPFLGYALFPVNYLFEFLRLLAAVLSQVVGSYSAVLPSQFISVVLYFILILVMSRLCVADRRYKAIISAIILAFLVVVLV